MCPLRMAAQTFTRNYSDHSSDTGFQFEFHCDKCGNGYRSTFKANTVGVAGKLFKAAGSLFGGNSLWSAGNAADHLKDGLRGPAWDSAFKEAIEEIKPKFHQCTRCGIWVCPEVCWNEAKGLCENCAPDLMEEAAAAQAHAARDQVNQKAREHDQTGGLDMSGAAQHLAGCPHCHARLTPGARFCAGCGKSVAPVASQKTFCSQCGAEKPGGARFCPGCGAQG
jgi:Double zinc ribbon